MWTLGKDAAYNLGNSAKSTWAGSFGTENALNTLYGQNMGAPLLGMSAIQASLMAAQVVPAAKGAQALGKGALRAGKTIGEKGLFQLGRGEGIANAGVSGKLADVTVGRKITKNTTILGENMMERVIPYADKTGFRTLPFGTTAEKWAKMTPKERWKLNDGALRKRISEGDNFKYIGQDAYRDPALRRQFDLTGSELLRLNKNGIKYDVVSPSSVKKVIERQ